MGLWCGLTPKLLWHSDFIEGWNFCQLEVLECKEVPWPNAVIENKYCIEDCGWPSKDVAYECKINLLTGRTHQVPVLCFLFHPFFVFYLYFSFNPVDTTCNGCSCNFPALPKMCFF